LRVPNDCRELALVVARFHGLPHRAHELRPETILKLLLDTDALRQPRRFEQFLQACTADYCGRSGYESLPFSHADYLRAALRAAAGIDAGAIARLAGDNPLAIRDKVQEARLAAVIRWHASTPRPAT
jgi:tRNA nucleotidyltransferase (CCA-adding enzyme)